MKKSRNNRRKQAKKQLIRFLTALIITILTVSVILLANKNVTNADENSETARLNKYYKTITIEAGDTLWSIAKEYKSGAYKNTKAYVDELMSMNNLHSDEIMSGQKLLVAYFAE